MPWDSGWALLHASSNEYKCCTGLSNCPFDVLGLTALTGPCGPCLPLMSSATIASFHLFRLFSSPSWIITASPPGGYCSLLMTFLRCCSRNPYERTLYSERFHMDSLHRFRNFALFRNSWSSMWWFSATQANNSGWCARGSKVLTLVAHERRFLMQLKGRSFSAISMTSTTSSSSPNASVPSPMVLWNEATVNRPFG